MQSERTPKLEGKEDCSESKQAVHERTRAVVEDLKRRLANTQGSTTTVTQEGEVDNWDSFDSSSSLLDDEHIYEEIDELTEVFGTKTDEDLFLHSKFSAVSRSKSTLCTEEEVLVKTPDITTASIHNLAQISSHEAQEAATSGEAAKFERKVPEERKDAKGNKLRPIIKVDKADVATVNKEKQCSSTSHPDTNVDTSSGDEEDGNFCFVIGF
ncbi:unnamed protein product [Cylicocyclus nassatus]|uniref:Uncharacterized protein n=1 Tax=Cylicocyclus nassatus TaxID=53992 RepID=A0AA36M2U8_CYLNA|nr:unnamed protein product [Cylicocyclus nassatus]